MSDCNTCFGEIRKQGKRIKNDKVERRDPFWKGDKKNLSVVGALKKTHEGCEKYVVLQVKRRTNTETPREEQASCITGTARPMWP